MLGRGIQLADGEWRPTPDLEVYRQGSDRPLHYAFPTTPNPDDPLCLVGGGQLNLDAAVAAVRAGARTVVLGFAAPSRYLREVGGPSESVVMSAALRRASPRADIIEWSGPPGEETNTESEVRNALGLARERGFTSVRFLTVSPHLPRVLLIAQLASIDLGRTGSSAPDWDGVSSDSIVASLGAANRARVARLRSSAAYRRTVAFESRGVALVLERLARAR